MLNYIETLFYHKHTLNSIKYPLNFFYLICCNHHLPCPFPLLCAGCKRKRRYSSIFRTVTPNGSIMICPYQRLGPGKSQFLKQLWFDNRWWYGSLPRTGHTRLRGSTTHWGTQRDGGSDSPDRSDCPPVASWHQKSSKYLYPTECLNPDIPQTHHYPIRHSFALNAKPYFLIFSGANPITASFAPYFFSSICFRAFATVSARSFSCHYCHIFP